MSCGHMQCIDYGDTVTHGLAAPGFKHSVKVIEAIRIAEILLVKRQFRLPSIVGRFEDYFQPQQRTVPEFKVGVGEHDESAFSDLRLAPERSDKHAAIDEYANHPLYWADPPLDSNSSFLISSRERILNPEASALSLIARRRCANLEISGRAADPFLARALFGTTQRTTALNP
jgi:hypothetical protein